MRIREFNRGWSACFVSAALLVLVYLGACAAASQDNLLQSLVQKNEAAWQKIQSLPSIQYTMERQWLDRQLQQPFHGVGQVKKKGNCCWSTYRCTIHTGPMQVIAEKERKVGDRSVPMQLLAPDTSAGQTEETEIRVVVNEKYMADWRKTANPRVRSFAYQRDYNSVDDMGSKMREHLTRSMPPEFLQNCFGTGSRRFHELLQSDPNRIRFDAVELKGADGTRRYEIRRFYPKDAPPTGSDLGDRSAEGISGYGECFLCGAGDAVPPPNHAGRGSCAGRMVSGGIRRNRVYRAETAGGTARRHELDQGNAQGHQDQRADPR